MLMWRRTKSGSWDTSSEAYVAGITRGTRRIRCPICRDDDIITCHFNIPYSEMPGNAVTILVDPKTGHCITMRRHKCGTILRLIDKTEDFGKYTEFEGEVP